MNKTFFRSAWTVLTILAAQTNLHGIDRNNRYFAYGLGEKTCQNYINFWEKKLENLERQYERYSKEELYEIVDKVSSTGLRGFSLPRTS